MIATTTTTATTTTDAFGDLTTEAMKRAGVVEENYQFGDLSKSAVTGLGRAVTGDDKYQFGDLTNELGRSVTGDEDYKFGDITKRLWKTMVKGEGEGDSKDQKGKERGS